MECPIPHKIPIRVECLIFPCFPRMVVTAATWSASVACLNPKRNPKPRTVKRESMVKFGKFEARAAGLGIEPRLEDPKSSVLPLNDPAMWIIDIEIIT